MSKSVTDIIAHKQTQLTHRQHLTQQSAIAHNRWNYIKSSGAQITADVFFNPDTTSPVAAILISHGVYRGDIGARIDLIPRSGDVSDDVYAAVKNTGIHHRGYSHLDDESEKELVARGISLPTHGGTNVILLAGSNDLHGDTQTTQHFQDSVSMLSESNVLSADASIREALMDAMRQRLVSLRNYDSPEQIGHDPVSRTR